MHPILFHLPLPGGDTFPIHSYGVVLALAVVLGVTLGARVLRERGLPLERGVLLLLVCAFTGLATGRVGYQVERWFMGADLNLDRLVREAGSYHVGVVLGLLAGLALARRIGTSRLSALDALGVASAAAQGLGRVGCYLAGCCFGCATDGPTGVCFPAATSARTGVPSGVALHPVQLYESVWLLALALFLWRSRTLARKPGRRAAVFLVGWGLGRFALEYLRAEPRVSFAMFTAAQLVALALLLLGVAIWCIAERRAGA